MLKKLITALFFTAAVVTTNAQTKDFELTKNIDIFLNGIREFQDLYVDSLSMEQLINYSFEGITENLDPYTEFVPAKDQEDFDFQTNMRYAGIGSLIQKDSSWAIIAGPYKGFPADKAGLVAGDRILEIDGKSIEGMDLDKVSNMLRGDANTFIKLKVLKLRTSNIEELNIERENIRISSVPYYGMIQDGIGYIKLTGFTRNCSNDMRDALKELRATGELKSLVLDLRTNGGGLLSEAVKIVNFFVPKGTTIVESKGRNKQLDFKYTTMDDPIEPDLPLTILVNGASASASEIVSGAIQDLDRGIIIGTHTFGKGYVQSIRPLGYDAQLKITTAKYYIPSGRCVQAHNFTTRNSDGSVAFIPDSLKKEFKTKNGRPVFDGGGVTPDVVISPEDYSPIIISLIRGNHIFRYSVDYYKKHLTINTPDKFTLTDKEYQNFINYLSNKEYDYQTVSERSMKQLINNAKQEKYYDNSKELFDKLNEALKHDKVKDLKINEKEIKAFLVEELMERYYYSEGRIRASLRYDRQFNEACDILNNPIKYSNLLQPSVKK